MLVDIFLILPSYGRTNTGGLELVSFELNVTFRAALGTVTLPKPLSTPTSDTGKDVIHSDIVLLSSPHKSSNILAVVSSVPMEGGRQ